MADMTIYIEAVGFAEDENGNPTPGGMAVKLGEYKPGKELPYVELVDGKDPVAFLRVIMPGFVDRLSAVRFITPEEYEREYGEDAEDDI